MAQKILIKKSTIEGKVPLAADLEIGELAINTFDAKLYTKHSDGEVKLLKGDAILPDVISANTFTKVTTDSKGRVISGTILGTSDIPELDISKITNLTSYLEQKAPLLSPSFSGTPVAPTPNFTDNSTKIATTEFVQNLVATTGGYAGWTISDGTNDELIGSGSSLTMLGTGSINVGYDSSNNTVTISTELPDGIINILDEMETLTLAGL